MLYLLWKDWIASRNFQGTEKEVLSIKKKKSLKHYPLHEKKHELYWPNALGLLGLSVSNRPLGDADFVAPKVFCEAKPKNIRIFSLYWLIDLWPYWSSLPRRLFSSWGEQGLLSSYGVWAWELWFLGCRARAQQWWCMWNLLEPAIDPCLLHWQAGSLPLSHQGSPRMSVCNVSI